MLDNKYREAIFKSGLTTLLITITIGNVWAKESRDRKGDHNNEVKAITIEKLGEKIFFDKSLSANGNQSCGSCHKEKAGWADPDREFATSEGSERGVFGARNAPTTAYAAFVPEMGINERGNFFGGLFLDGRASTLEEQAGLPFLNPIEMNNADKQEVIMKLMQARYSRDFETIFGEGIFNDTELAYEKMTEAIAAFERTDKQTAFTSKFDAVQRGEIELTPEEQNGFEVFLGKGLCANCHAIAEPNVFSGFAYFNLGVPANPENPFFTQDSTVNPDGENFIDLGLGTFLNDPEQNGKFRTPTLRNIAKTAPYMHNGVFNKLEEVVDFYNNRDVDGVVPEVAENVADFATIGELGLTDEESQNLVAFMRTLTDGFDSSNDSDKPRR